MNINKQKESETNSKEGAGLPSAVDDAADVMSKYPTKKRISSSMTPMTNMSFALVNWMSYQTTLRR